MNLGDKIRRSTLWLLTGNTSTQLVNFVIGIVLARILSPKDFGLLVAIQVFTGVASFFSGAGMGQAIIQSKNITRRDYNVVFTLQLLIGVFIYSSFYYSSPWFSDWYKNPIYEDLIRISTLVFLTRPFVTVPRSLLQRELNYKPLTIINFSGLLIGNGISIYMALNQFKVWSLVIGGLCGSVATGIMLLIYTKYLPIIQFDLRTAKELGKYGFKASLNDFLGYLREQAPNLLIGRYLNPTTLGLFNKGYSLSAYPIRMIAGSAYQTVFRALSSTQDNLDKSKYIYLRTITLVSAYTIPFYVVLFWLAEPFIIVIYGERWHYASIPLQIFSISRIIACVGNPSGAVLAARNLLGKEIIVSFISLLLAIAGCWFGIMHGDLSILCIALLPSIFFTHFTISILAMRAMKTTFLEIIKALRVALILNSILIIFISFCHLALKTLGIGYLTFEYLVSISISSALLYALMFCFIPLKEIEKESERWKNIFRNFLCFRKHEATNN